MFLFSQTKSNLNCPTWSSLAKTCHSVRFSKKDFFIFGYGLVWFLWGERCFTKVWQQAAVLKTRLVLSLLFMRSFFLARYCLVFTDRFWNLLYFWKNIYSKNCIILQRIWFYRIVQVVLSQKDLFLHQLIAEIMCRSHWK